MGFHLGRKILDFSVCYNRKKKIRCCRERKRLEIRELTRFGLTGYVLVFGKGIKGWWELFSGGWWEMVVGCAFWCHEVLCGEAAMKDLFGDVFLMIKDKDASIAWYLGTLES